MSHYKYTLQTVSPTYTSNSVMTPGREMRPTQSNVGEMATVVCDEDGVPISSKVIEPLTEQYLNAESYHRKGFWVDPPIQDAYYIQSTKRHFVESLKDLEPSDVTSNKLFPAPYYTDLEYIKMKRLEKLPSVTPAEDETTEKMDEKNLDEKPRNGVESQPLKKPQRRADLYYNDKILI